MFLHVEFAFFSDKVVRVGDTVYSFFLSVAPEGNSRLDSCGLLIIAEKGEAGGFADLVTCVRKELNTVLLLLLLLVALKAEEAAVDPHVSSTLRETTSLPHCCAKGRENEKG